MITLAVNSGNESSRNALQLIYNQSRQNGMHTIHIKPQDTSVYFNHKKISLRSYIEHLQKREAPDLLIVELTKEALEKAVYDQLRFNVALFFDKPSTKHILSKNGIYTRLFKLIRASYYIIPESYHHKDQRYITYGWSEAANISASSAELQVNGSLSVQCCVNPTTSASEIKSMREFTVEVPFNDVEATLASVATMLIYGIKIN
ncbi:MAG: hypothetical protein RR448_02300 [Niameybacter sp.]|uniref:hypothetical protein n=1 Tax=Niameybacter sp. TaxID=2033640 RepID=UPI002FC5D237